MEKNVLRNLSYGVYVLGTKNENKNVGCIINSAIQVTSEPTILISVHHDNYTNESIKKCRKFSLSILKENSNSGIIGKFGYTSSKDTDKFKGFQWEDVENIPIIKDSCGNIICEVIDTVETSTHTLFIGKVINLINYTNENPMTYRYYHNELKGTSPKNAPTFIEEKKVKGWKCSVCGYVVEKEVLDEDFVCPICGQKHTAFYKIEE